MPINTNTEYVALFKRLNLSALCRDVHQVAPSITDDQTKVIASLVVQQLSKNAPTEAARIQENLDTLRKGAEEFGTSVGSFVTHLGQGLVDALSDAVADAATKAD